MNWFLCGYISGIAIWGIWRACVWRDRWHMACHAAGISSGASRDEVLERIRELRQIDLRTHGGHVPEPQLSGKDLWHVGEDWAKAKGRSPKDEAV